MVDLVQRELATDRTGALAWPLQRAPEGRLRVEVSPAGAGALRLRGLPVGRLARQVSPGQGAGLQGFGGVPQPPRPLNGRRRVVGAAVSGRPRFTGRGRSRFRAVRRVPGQPAGVGRQVAAESQDPPGRRSRPGARPHLLAAVFLVRPSPRAAERARARV